MDGLILGVIILAFLAGAYFINKRRTKRSTKSTGGGIPKDSGRNDSDVKESS